jgi:hypothetical protein
MKTTAKILLAIVVALGLVKEAGAQTAASGTIRRYTVAVGEQRIGIADYGWKFDMGDVETTSVWTSLQLGPFGEYKVPFTATEGLVGFCVILAILMIVPAVFAVRWKKKWAT